MKKFTNRKDFPDVLPDGVSSYCPKCHECLGNRRIKIKLEQNCELCGAAIDRALVWDDGIKQYFDNTGTIIHESVGVFIINEKKEILLFSLSKFPYGYTIPAGHVDTGEDPVISATRELQEEVGISVDSLEHIGNCIIEQDSCSRGADVHKWNAYMMKYDGQAIILNDEGSKPEWFSLDAIPDSITVAIKTLLSNGSILQNLKK